MPTQILDLVLHAKNEGLSPEAASEEVGLSVEQVKRAYCDIDQKRATTRYLHLGPQLVEPVDITVNRDLA
jgi:NAD+ synthase